MRSQQAAVLTLTGWAMTITAGFYSYQARCTGVLTGTPTIIQLPSGITFSSGPTTFTFQVLTHGTDLSVPLNLVLVGSGKTSTIQISPSGDISDL